MDADYYFATGVELASGRGFTEPFLWNYLDNPEGLPHPSHSYWMPLTSLVAASSMRLMGVSFRIAQIPFILLTAVLPLLAARVALHLGLGQRKAWLAGLLACVPGFFLPYFVTTETFSLFAIVGGLALWTMAAPTSASAWWKWPLAGALVGLAHLTRADGFILLIPAFFAVWHAGHRRRAGWALVMAGYLLVMAPWWWRNVSVFGTPFPPGTDRALWLVSYDDLFAYPATRITFQHWLSAGLASHVLTRLQALGTNLQSLFATNGLIFLAPLMITGMIRRWKQLLVRLSALYLGLLLIVMSFVLPDVGSRGGFFHSSAALMPVLWALAVDGLDWSVAWVGGRRDWNLEQAQRFFRVGVILLALLVTVVVYWGRVIGDDAARPAWTSSHDLYREVGEHLDGLAADDRIVAVNNPPGVYAAADLPAVVIPNGPIDTLQQVVDRYDVAWVILEGNHPLALAGLYAQSIVPPWLQLVEEISVDDMTPALLFHVIADEVQP
jgi:4-amino-4-deoxy-L-arabinose transferase-like glycosyltransferase